jgi:hypothetical protein
MNKAQLAKALNVARSDFDLSGVDDSPLHGCALPDFGPVVVSLRCVARLLRDFKMLNGEMDETELQPVYTALLSRKITVLDENIVVPGSEPFGQVYEQDGETKYTNKNGATWVLRTVQNDDNYGTVPVWVWRGWLNL